MKCDKIFLLNLKPITTMIKTENDCQELTQKMPASEMDFLVFAPRQHSHKITYNLDGFHKPNFETQTFIVDWQLEVGGNFDVEKIWY